MTKEEARADGENQYRQQAEADRPEIERRLADALENELREIAADPELGRWISRAEVTLALGQHKPEEGPATAKYVRRVKVDLYGGTK